MKPAQYKCMSLIIVIIVSVAYFQHFVLPQKNGRANPSSPDICVQILSLL